MTLSIGVDVGPLLATESLAEAAREVGATHVRAHLALVGHANPDEEYLASARDALETLRALGLGVTLAVGSDITVAKGGLGAFSDPPEGVLAEAWVDEWRQNLSTVARALASHVSSWELLPNPAAAEASIAPRRWLALLVAGAEAVRTADPDAVVLPGAVVADSSGSIERFVGQALDAEGAELWHEAGLSGLVVDLQVAPEGGDSEADVIAAVRRTIDTAATLASERLLEPVGVPLVLVSWSAGRSSDDLQARNLWAAFNTLTAQPSVGTVMWCGLQDAGGSGDAARASGDAGGSRDAAGGGDTGLFRAGHLDPANRRPAWLAFNDFSVYAAQIAPPFAAAALLDQPSTPAERIRFRIPSVAEILRAQGLHGRRLDAAIATASRTHGESPPPGEYEIELPGGLESGPEYTNQDVISAFYRAGMGTWDLLEKSGLALRDLATDRNAPYAGPPVESLSALDEAELASVVDELGSAVRK